MKTDLNDFFMKFNKTLQKENIINLGIGQPNFKPPKKIIDAFKENLEYNTGYTPSMGIEELRNSIINKLKKENNIKAEEVIVTAGAIEAIFSSMFTHLTKDSEIILFSPCYHKYTTVPNQLGTKIIYLKMKNKRFDIQKLRDLISKKTKMIVINSPSNPAGLILNNDEIKHITELAEEKGIILLSDEVYEKYVYDNRTHISPGHFSDNVITINSFSKTFGFPGLRIGYLAGPKKLVDPILPIHMSNTTCSPFAAQKAAVEALKLNLNFFDIGSFDKKRKFLIDILNENGLEYVFPEGAFYVYVYINKNSLKLSNELLEENLLLLPGRVFGDEKEAVRISYATDMTSLKKGIDILIKKIVN